MHTEQTKLSLRIVVGIASIRRAQIREGYEPTEPNEMYEDTPVVGRGTPCQPPPAQRFQIGRRNTEVPPFRKFLDVELSAHTSIYNAADQLCRLFEPNAPPQATTLTLALATCVEEEQMLAGFSAAVIAAGCVEVAAAALDMEILISRGAFEELNILPDPIRLAYNNLWLQRSTLEPAIWSGGGDPGLLTPPMAADGKLDKVMFNKGVGIPVRSPPRYLPRNAKFQRKSHPLRYVALPPAAPEPSENTSNVGANYSEHESWDKTSRESCKS